MPDGRVATFGGDVSSLVPPDVLVLLTERLAERAAEDAAEEAAAGTHSGADSGVESQEGQGEAR